VGLHIAPGLAYPPPLLRTEATMGTGLSPITPIMLVLLWRRQLYGGWRYYAITN
jgi:hypothetical protein